MKSIRRFFALVLMSAFCVCAIAAPGDRTDNGAVASQGPSAPSQLADLSFPYTFDTSITAMQTGRINRNGVASTCASPKAFDQFDTLSYPFFTSAPMFNSTGSEVCATITLTPDAGCDVNVLPVAYLGSFDPTNIATNYLGDGGLSTGLPADSVSFEVAVPANSSIVIDLANLGNGGNTNSCSFTLSATNLYPTRVISLPKPVPALQVAALILLGICVLGIATLTVRRRRVNR